MGPDSPAGVGRLHRRRHVDRGRSSTTTSIYIGGHQRYLNNSYGQNDRGTGRVSAGTGIAALDPLNGLPYSWNPGRERGYRRVRVSH